MLPIIFAVQKLGNNIFFRIDRIKEEQRCRFVFFTLNRLSDAFTTLFFQHASAASNCPANIYYGVLDPRLFLNTFDRKRLESRDQTSAVTFAVCRTRLNFAQGSFK